MTRRTTYLALLGLTALAPLTAAHAQEFATQVVSSSGLGTNSLYNNPNAVLGQPTTQLAGGYFDSMVYPPYGKDPQGNDVIDTLGTAGEITVAFDTPIVHSDSHWYGDDFIVFGNSFFSGSTGVTPTTDMTTDTINPSGGIFQNGTPQISVSDDGINFVNLTPVTAWFPTNPYKWVGISAANPSGWDDTPGDLNDFTKPIDPSLTPSSFGGDTVADADNRLYDGSAGGAAFSLLGSGLSSVDYIRFTGTGNSSVIDAISRVSDDPAAVPEASSVVSFGLLLGLGLIIVRRSRKSISL
jgi:hypothetical protein